MNPKDPTAAPSPQGTAPAPLSLAEINARHRGRVRRYFATHPRLMDVVVVLCYLLLSLGTVISQAGAGNWAALAAVAGICAALMFRRRAPLLVFASVAVLELALSFAYLWANNLVAGLWFALYAVGSTQRRRVSVAALVLGPLPLVFRYVFGVTAQAYAEVFSSSAMPNEVSFRLSVILTTYLSCVIAVGFGISVRQRRRYEAALAAWAEQSTQWGRSAERSRIAREMHDVVAHSLTVMVSLADGARTVLTKDPERAGRVLEELSRTGRAALADTRRVLGVLREEGGAAPRAPLDSQEELERMVAGFRTAGLPLSFTYTGPMLPEDTTLRLSMYRILQESLTNVLRYGRSLSRVEVFVDHTPGLVSLKVINDGVGSVPLPGAAGAGAPGAGPQGSGQGIPGMRARAAMYGGTVTAAPLAGGGWRVAADLHYDQTGHRNA
ncbi:MULTISPECIES: histidine kinase [Arthrobacter]|uniref:histidine kinase n=2 Tax=Arthrobacter TaxID=1663 RepID=A0ABU9KJ31_9MICC|nr:histidine kinase [Arthrobacter sp. YJM1]MDP5226850.1 histidine kinase [Arthrobacter sp. YJM1]